MTFSGIVFFPSKVPEFLHVLFNLVEKHSPVFFFTEMLLFGSVAFIVHASIFYLRFFSETKCKPAQKNTGEWFTT